MGSSQQQSSPHSHCLLLQTTTPTLQFQHAKLKFENYLRSKTDAIAHTIVRPTAFFKSVSGQLEIVQKGEWVGGLIC